MKQIEDLKEYAGMLRLGYLRENVQTLLHEAAVNTPGYAEFLENVLLKEVKQRQLNDYQRRLKLARLPRVHNLEEYDYKASSSIAVRQMKQLRELLWVDQMYNLVLMGPSGTGKTFIAGGLVNDAIKRGYRAYFTTMADLINVLKRKEIISSAMSTYKRYTKAHLVAIDDIMMFPIEKSEAVSLFNLINHLHEHCSVIITTNKSPAQWAETLDDEVLATAMLDRLLYRCEVVKFEGNGYRMENRQSFLEKE
ncbi:MAG: IS21-like element helper ATPase IstB [Bacteroidia bacterium]|jgi:DNA replication protein DnaC|nr:IS21-like element helper ATPase IstB [Bacteroidia bacterium]